MVQRNSLGTYGLGTPVDISHSRVRSDVDIRTDCNLSEVEEDCNCKSSVSCC